jgi:hypothetical protein
MTYLIRRSMLSKHLPCMGENGGRIEADSRVLDGDVEGMTLGRASEWLSSN